MAGNAIVKANSQIMGDDSGENISAKNPYYSELTGIYWIWKNTDQDIVGTCHYRRFFTAANEPIGYQIKRLFYYPLGLYKKRFGLIYTSKLRFWEKRILNQSQLVQLLSSYDAILPQSRILKYSVETHFQRYHNARDLLLLESIISDRHPAYLETYHSVLKSNKLYANNMFVIKNNYFQEFMNWLFDILFEFERRSNISQYTGYQERILGFVAERLLTVWFKKNQLNCLELKVVYFKNLKFE